MKQCVKCLAETDDGALICHTCGGKKFFVKKESTIKCPRCGAMNPGGESVCYSCGHPFVGGHSEG